MAGRNLAIAESEGMDIAVVCPACFLRLRDTQPEFRQSAELREKLPGLIAMPYEAKYEVRHLLDVIHNTVRPGKVKEKVKKPLTGLKVVAYYGCYLVRPPEITGVDAPEYPQIMDRLLEALEADIIDWRGKVSCCGGGLLLTNRGVVKKLVAGIIDAAREVNAEAIVTACGLCSANLEARQGLARPVFYGANGVGYRAGCQALA